MRGEYTMSQIELNKIEKNKELVLEAFDTLFNQRDYIGAERYWSLKYIQHTAWSRRSLQPCQEYPGNTQV